MGASPSRIGDPLHPPHARVAGFLHLAHSMVEVDGIGGMLEDRRELEG
jgi:hypothetical protein